MVKIRWIITDFIEDVDLKDFNAEWNGIYGYFEICINNKILGFCPDRELLATEEGNEDILYWLSKLSDGIMQLNANKEYEIPLFSMNLAKIILKKDDKLLVSFVNSDTNEVIWSEKIMIGELCNEVILNIERFITEVQKINSVLLEADSIKKLISNKNILDPELFTVQQHQPLKPA